MSLQVIFAPQGPIKTVRVHRDLYAIYQVLRDGERRNLEQIAYGSKVSEHRVRVLLHDLNLPCNGGHVLKVTRNDHDEYDYRLLPNAQVIMEV